MLVLIVFIYVTLIALLIDRKNQVRDLLELEHLNRLEYYLNLLGMLLILIITILIINRNG